MAGPERLDVGRLMSAFISDERRLNAALALFAEREDLGFVWLAYREDDLVGCCSVSYAIGTAVGGLVAVVRDLYVRPEVRRTGVAGALLGALRERVAAAEATAIEVHSGTDTGLAAFLIARGFRLTSGVFTAAR